MDLYHQEFSPFSSIHNFHAMVAVLEEGLKFPIPIKLCWLYMFGSADDPFEHKDKIFEAFFLYCVAVVDI